MAGNAASRTPDQPNSSAPPFFADIPEHKHDTVTASLPRSAQDQYRDLMLQRDKLNAAVDEFEKRRITELKQSIAAQITELNGYGFRMALVTQDAEVPQPQAEPQDVAIPEEPVRQPVRRGRQARRRGPVQSRKQPAMETAAEMPKGAKICRICTKARGYTVYGHDGRTHRYGHPGAFTTIELARMARKAA